MNNKSITSARLSTFSRKGKSLVLLVSLLLLGACNKVYDTAGEYSQIGEPQKIRFEFTHATASSAGDSPQTRVATDMTTLVSTWQDGDKVGLFIVKGNTGLLTSGNHVENMVMEYNNGNWAYNLPDGKEYYPQDGDNLHFYAYYPYQAGADPTNITFTVQADQSTVEIFSKSHMLTARKENVSKSNDPVQLTFSHRQAMVRVGLSDGDNEWEKAPRRADEVILESKKTTTVVNLSTNSVTQGGDPVDIKMYAADDGYWYAMLAPWQQASSASELIEFRWNGLTTLKYTPESNFNLPPGEVKPLDITIKIKENDTEPNKHFYKVGDLYPYKSFTKSGVVYWIDPASSSDQGVSGTSGRVVSLDEDLRGWGPVAETGMSSETDGLENMAKVTTIPSWEPLYPAYAYTHAKNPPNTVYSSGAKGIWYLPASKEFGNNDGGLYKSIIEYGQTDFDNILTAAGGDIINFTGFTGYWTSTEFSDDFRYTWSFSFWFCSTDIANKSIRMRARPILVF